MKNNRIKGICVAMVTLFISFNAFAQSVPKKPGVVKGTITAKDSVIKQKKFSTEEFSGWAKVEKDFDANCFYKSLKANAINMSCKSCADVYMVLQMKFDALGSCIATKVIIESKCGVKMPAKLKQQWLNYFGGKYVFPPTFRGKVIEVQIGKQMSC